jgi:hypothetical protein
MNEIDWKKADYAAKPALNAIDFERIQKFIPLCFYGAVTQRLFTCARCD